MSINAAIDADVLVIGAGPAGLATAACLIERGSAPRVIERAGHVAASWRAHYDRLHLHTVKELSALPGLPFPAACPRYVSRQQFVDYLDAYTRHHGIAVELGQEAAAVSRAGGRWQTTTRTGRRFVADAVVVATGANRVPRAPTLAGQAEFGGRILHSSAYRNPAPFAGQHVLVVGMGNTGAEIALDLVEHGVAAALSVRSPMNIVHRDVLGRPTQRTSIALSRLPPSWGDALARALRSLTVGDLRRWGIRTSPLSPLRQLREQGRTPVVDVGTLARIKRGDIAVHPDVERLTARGVRFVDGAEGAFDAVILATGYRADLGELLGDAGARLDAGGLPVEVVGTGEQAGLYFVGFDIRQPGGLLRAIGAQAQQVADAVARARPG